MWTAPTRGRTIGDETRLNDPVKTMKVAVGVDVRGSSTIHDPHLRPRRKSAVNDGSRGKRSTERFPRNPHHGITIEIIATQHHKNQAKKRKKN